MLNRTRKIRSVILSIFSTLMIFPIIQSKIVHGKEESSSHFILIINSYNQGFAWTKDQVDGITEKIVDSCENIQIAVEYLDWKNYPDESNENYLKRYFTYKYEDKEIDLIIATDDAALDFVLDNREELLADIPIVFSGVNQEAAEKITEGQDNVTGVIEVVDPTATIQLATKINPNIKNVYLLFDNTESGLTTGELVRSQIKAKFPEMSIISLNRLGYNKVIETVSNLKEDSIVFITTYTRDVYNKVLDMNFVNQDVSNNSSVPVYHLYDFALNRGTIGGQLLSGRIQGEEAARLALRIMEGENADDIPFVKEQTTRDVIDYHQLDRFNIPLSLIPENIEIINKPFSFYETYKVYLWAVITIFFILIVFISILLFYINRINKMKKNLAESHEELTQLYEELTASDEEMKQQYDEMLEINEKIRIGEEKLSYIAYHDVLTGLPNKISLTEYAAKILAPGKEKIALLFLDMDKFKNVNDTMGHDFGDKLIKSFSERICSMLDDRCSIYRLSGDEFIVLIEKVNSILEVQQIAKDILACISEDFVINNIVTHIGVSIGISIYPDHGNNLDQLLKYADIAMYKVKDNGRKNYVIYSSNLSEVFTERVNIERYLNKALENNEFELYYQPQVNINTKQITGFEALLRWNNPELGSVSPLKFIPIAEETRQIIPIGTWVLQKACAFLKHLHTQGYDDLIVSVNISTIQLLQRDFCDLVTGALQYYGLEPGCLELEVTESVLMESIDYIENKLRKLKMMNINIALDDFGKGYSSLNYLRQLPITTLKVDKSFIDCILEKKQSTLTGHIITIGKSMGMSVVAEGVEKTEQMEYLKSYNCDKIQGYLFSKPLPEVEILKLLETSFSDGIG